ncbi:cysteine-rich CWC family protein [Shewanella sp. JM162201]|uniref:Cysteine-rich CWC family protein n=1 Tax=Shewanella jiangmenensis TaxID=2837387 RepID=A0ABS5V106_9GAMM|nr:cysteine-rich CWC family protein [Shewanella jiangmenensis]
MSDKSYCPLCQQANRCAMELGQPIEHCWCSRAEFPKALPADLSACLCPECAARLAKLEKLQLKQVT